MDSKQEENQTGENTFYHCLKPRKEAGGHMHTKLCEQAHYEFIFEPGGVSSGGF